MKKNSIAIVVCFCLLVLAIFLGTKSTPPSEKTATKTKSENSPRLVKNTASSQLAEDSERAATRSENGREEADTGQPDNQLGFGTLSYDQAQALNQVQESLAQRNQAKIADLLSVLAEDLNLTSAQKEALQAYLEKQSEISQSIYSGGNNIADSNALLKAAAALSGEGLDDIMENVLTEEQLGKWQARKQKRLERFADSTALKNLADLASKMDLREDQRAKLYDHFYQKSLSSGTYNPSALSNPLGSLLGTFTGGENGAVMTQPHSFAPGTTPGGAEGAAADGTSQEVDVQAMLRQQREENIAQQVEELAPILDEDQLQDYRENLESQISPLENLLKFTNYTTIDPSGATSSSE